MTLRPHRNRRCQLSVPGSSEKMMQKAAGLGVDYAASKGAMDVLTIGLSREVAAEGIRVNAVRPGLIDTEIHAAAGDADRASKAKDFVPMKRAGRAEEVAQAIAWLVSDASSYSTGAVVDVSGGV